MTLLHVLQKVLVAFLLLCGWALNSNVRGDEEQLRDIEDDAPLPSGQDLDEMIAYLRDDDKRLIRYNVPSDLVWIRQEKLCAKQLEPLLVRLSTRFDADSNITLEDQIKIVELLTLCSSEHPDFRNTIGTFEEGVALKAIISLLDEGQDSITAVVGAAIWILSFADQFNHNYFTERAVEKMASILVERAKALDQMDEASKPACALAIMWMAAALQNLAASYCETDSGHCWWEYGFSKEAEDGGIYLHEDSPLEVDATKAAEAIVKSVDGELVSVLHRLVCADPMTSEEEHLWASEATIHGTSTSRISPRIITWAVARLLKNLSMYEGTHEVTVAAKDCLCLLTRSSVLQGGRCALSIRIQRRRLLGTLRRRRWRGVWRGTLTNSPCQ